MAHTLVDLPAESDEDTIRVVIETPMGSPNKFDYDPELRSFTLREVLPRGMQFPFDFGFVPSTLADDDDPVDVLLLSDGGLTVGTVLDARLIGVLEFEDTKHGKTERNDRLVAVPTASVLYATVKSVRDLPETLLKQVEAFFERDVKSKGKKRRLLGCKDGKVAHKRLEAGMATFRKKNKA